LQSNTEDSTVGKQEVHSAPEAAVLQITEDNKILSEQSKRNMENPELSPNLLRPT
jgi:hypothetical protein